ncbi:hypothetical protein GCM10022261_22820 [Brevibacterium daeguense]|uniref:Uncharacterized protein n=1 Tax=Brevibacterium daeguense TaxID=909936 RepID=A0ABP8EL91_9MICO|nr:hypothetical protein [Brevibacterium daeguense]
MPIPPVPMPNLYRHDLVANAPRVAGNGDAMAEAVDDLIRIMDGGAWVSSTADEYYAALTAHRSPCQAAGAVAAADMSTKAAGEPPLVNIENPAEAWKATWVSI